MLLYHQKTMLLFNELKDCSCFTVDLRDDPINNTNNRVERNSRKKYFLPTLDTTDYNMDVCVCVCVCVCMCVFVLFHVSVSSGCTTSITYVRCSDQQSFVVSIIRGFCQVPSSLFINLSYLTSKDENSSWQLLERKRMIQCWLSKRLYI